MDLIVLEDHPDYSILCPSSPGDPSFSVKQKYTTLWECPDALVQTTWPGKWQSMEGVPDTCGLASTLAPLSSTVEGVEFGDIKALSVLEGHQIK